MQSSLWQILGYVGMIGYLSAILLVLFARYLLKSKREIDVRRGRMLLALLGGVYSGPFLRKDMERQRQSH